MAQINLRKTVHSRLPLDISHQSEMREISLLCRYRKLKPAKSLQVSLFNSLSGALRKHKHGLIQTQQKDWLIFTQLTKEEVLLLVQLKVRLKNQREMPLVDNLNLPRHLFQENPSLKKLVRAPHG